MARRLNRGDIHLYNFAPPDKQRPVVILTFDEIIPFMTYVTVAPISSKVRDSDGEVRLGIDDGMKDVCAVKLHSITTVQQQTIGPRIGSLSPSRLEEICRAIRFALGCHQP